MIKPDTKTGTAQPRASAREPLPSPAMPPYSSAAAAKAAFLRAGVSFAHENSSVKMGASRAQSQKREAQISRTIQTPRRHSTFYYPP